MLSATRGCLALSPGLDGGWGSAAPVTLQGKQLMVRSRGQPPGPNAATAALQTKLSLHACVCVTPQRGQRCPCDLQGPSMSFELDQWLSDVSEQPDDTTWRRSGDRQQYGQNGCPNHIHLFMFILAVKRVFSLFPFVFTHHLWAWWMYPVDSE